VAQTADMEEASISIPSPFRVAVWATLHDYRGVSEISETRSPFQSWAALLKGEVRRF